MCIYPESIFDHCTHCGTICDAEVLIQKEDWYVLVCKNCFKYIRVLTEEERKRYDYYYLNKGNLLPSEESPFP